jgi:hypothetical protein
MADHASQSCEAYAARNDYSCASKLRMDRGRLDLRGRWLTRSRPDVRVSWRNPDTHRQPQQEELYL